jgi:antitoxin (DNA-binding transcriptional repressor) of toxin-antitoxin stability system
MRTIPASKARTHFYKILDDVERGETIFIARNGKQIAQIESYPPKAGFRDSDPKAVPPRLKPR